MGSRESPGSLSTNLKSKFKNSTRRIRYGGQKKEKLVPWLQNEFSGGFWAAEYESEVKNS